MTCVKNLIRAVEAEVTCCTMASTLSSRGGRGFPGQEQGRGAEAEVIEGAEREVPAQAAIPAGPARLVKIQIRTRRRKRKSRKRRRRRKIRRRKRKKRRRILAKRKRRTKIPALIARKRRMKRGFPGQEQGRGAEAEVIEGAER